MCVALSWLALGLAAPACWAQRFAGEPILFFGLSPATDDLREQADLETNRLLSALSLRGATPLWYDSEDPTMIRAVAEGALRPEDLKFRQVDRAIAMRLVGALHLAAAVYGSLARKDGQLVAHLCVIEGTHLRMGEVDVSESDGSLPGSAVTAIYNELKRLEALGPSVVSAIAPPGPAQGSSSEESQETEPPSSPAETATGPSPQETGESQPAPAIEGPELSGSPPTPDSGHPTPDTGSSDPFRRGMALAAAGQVEEAAEAFEAAHRAEPDNPRILVELAQVYWRIGRLDDSRQTFEQALSLDPDNPQIRQMLERSRQAAGSAVPNGGGPAGEFAAPGRADLANLRALADRQPDNPEVVRALAEAYMGRGDFASAARTYEALARLRPADPAVQRELGRAYARAGEPERAARALLQAIQWDPKDAEAHLALAEVYAAAKEFDRALEQYAASSASWEGPRAMDADATRQMVSAVRAALPGLLERLEAALRGAAPHVTGGAGFQPAPAAQAQPPPREEVFRQATALHDQALGIANVFSRVEPPAEWADLVDQWLLAAGLAAQSTANLATALDASDVPALSRGIWCYNQAIAEAKRALDMGLPQG